MPETKKILKTKKILIIHDNPQTQQHIKDFFNKIFACEFETKKTFIKTYELLQKPKIFDFVVVPDVIKGIVEGGFGEDLIPCIKNSSSAEAKICIFASDEYYHRKAKNAGVDLRFNADILGKKMIVCKLSRTPIVFISKPFKILKIG